MKVICFLLAVVLLAMSASALSVSTPLYTPINHVSDYAELITPEWEAQINGLASDIKKNTTVEIAVLTVPSLQGQNIESLAIEVFQDWGVGKKDVDNGLLLLVALEEKEWRIEIGYGLEPLITDAMAGRFGREILAENFRQGDYGKGIYEFVGKIHSTIKGEQDSVAIVSQENPEKKSIGQLLLFLFIGITFVLSFMTQKLHKKTRWAIRCGAGITFLLILAMIQIFLAVFYALFLVFALLPKINHSGFGGFNGGFSGRGLKGRGGFGGSGGFGGFGGGSSGGGGASGKW